MSSTNNKVKFGLKNCHYAKATLDPDTNVVTFGTPVAIPGAVNLSLDPEGDTEPFYADDMVYYTTVANNGYSGDLEIALIPDSFRKDILKETEDANGVLVEDSTVEPEHFALLFEFSGDKKKIRHCMYYCTAARPTIEGKTNEDDSASEWSGKGEDRCQHFRCSLQRMVFRCLSDGERTGICGAYRDHDREPEPYA